MKSFFSKIFKNRRMFFRICCVMAIMLLLLLSPATALRGAAYGLTLWYRTLFPTLMPFMVLSNFIVYTGCARPLGALLRPLTTMLKLPQSSGYCIITGFLCGYPMGAYVCGSLNEVGELDDDTAAFLAPICNNVSPMFMISYICMNCLDDEHFSRPVITILMGSAAVAMLLSRFIYIYTIKHKKSSGTGSKTRRTYNKTYKNIEYKNNNNQDKNISATSMSTSDAISRAVEGALMASLKLCIYVMLFSIAGAMIDNVGFLSDITKAAVMSILEITAGLDKISMLDISLEYKFLMMLTFTAFGGMSSIFQTMSLWTGKKFNFRKYIFYKAVVTLVTASTVLLTIVVGIL